ncbi:hypothetical protein E2320_012629 [Naja naja]|nr:hypothetical protein E2320_012629 [Naja naja]
MEQCAETKFDAVIIAFYTFMVLKISSIKSNIHVTGVCGLPVEITHIICNALCFRSILAEDIVANINLNNFALFSLRPVLRREGVKKSHRSPCDEYLTAARLNLRISSQCVFLLTAAQSLREQPPSFSGGENESQGLHHRSDQPALHAIPLGFAEVETTKDARLPACQKLPHLEFPQSFFFLRSPKLGRKMPELLGITFLALSWMVHAGTTGLWCYDSQDPKCVKMTLDGASAAEQINITRGGLRDTYRALQFHFHWGDLKRNGSEHYIDGIQYPMELHIVHMNIKYKTVNEAKQHPNGLAVLSFLFKNGAASSPLPNHGYPFA